MSQAIVLDTETTGLDEPDVIQIAYAGPYLDPQSVSDNQVSYRQQYFQPRKPITAGAMAAHHIIPDDLIDCDLWPGKWMPPEGTDYVIGHGVDYDWKAIGSPHVARIDTCALARMVWPDAVDFYSLGALTYFLLPPAEARRALKKAHSAAIDVANTVGLLGEILKMLPGTMSWHQLWQTSEKARIPRRMPFGKHGPKDGKPGRLIEEIRRFDPGYVHWCLSQPDFDPYLIKALKGAA